MAETTIVPPPSVPDPVPLPPTPAPTLASLPLPPSLSALITLSYIGDKDGAGRFQGQGCLTFIDGNVYTGAFDNGQMHGTGEYIFANGVTYTGAFQYNKITGSGSYSWSDGSTYVGAVAEGLRHGKGVYTAADKVIVYDGDWEGGVRCGTGICYFDSAKTVSYSGEWKDNVRNGTGTVTYKSGNMYTGLWKDNKKHGDGVMNWIAVAEMYSGQWVADKQEGYGEHVWLNESEGLSTQGDVAKQRCNMYKGQFKGGLRSGTGTFFYANGAQYQGAWKNNIKEGYGVFTYPDGHVYEGIFENDRMPGKDEKERQTEDVSPQIVLNITDLMNASTQEAKHELKLLENALLRYHTELKVCYKHYAQIDTSTAAALQNATGVVFTLSADQLRVMCKECNLLSSNLSFSDVGDVLLRMRRHHAISIKAVHLAAGESMPMYEGEDEGGLLLHDATRPVLFREFVEGLVRIAHARFCVTNPDLTIRDAIRLVMEDHVRVYATQSGLHHFEEKLNEPKVRAVFATHDAVLRETFDAYRTGPDGTMYMKDWVVLCMDASPAETVISTKEALHLTAPSFHDHHHQHHHFHPEEDRDALHNRMVYCEFVEAVARLAHHLKKDQVPLQEKIKWAVENVVRTLLKVLKEGGDKKGALQGQKVLMVGEKKRVQRPARKVIL